MVPGTAWPATRASTAVPGSVRFRSTLARSQRLALEVGRDDGLGDEPDDRAVGGQHGSARLRPAPLKRHRRQPQSAGLLGIPEGVAALESGFVQVDGPAKTAF